MMTPFFGLLLLVVTWSGCTGDEDTRRPFYNIAHMTNNRATVDGMLKEGANALEVDLNFDEETGLPTKFYHGGGFFKCDCFRSCKDSEDPEYLLEYIRNISTPDNPDYNKGFSGLLWIDLKLHNIDSTKLEKSGHDFAPLLMSTLNETKGTHLKILLGIWKPDEFKFIKGAVEELRLQNAVEVLCRIAVAGSQKEHFEAYIAANAKLGLPHMWLDEGSINCASIFFKLTDFKEAIRLRDEVNGVSKVCRWTVDTKKYMRNALSVGADSIMTNDPDDLYEVLKEPDFRGKFRLATAEDKPFKKVQGHGPFRVGCYYRKKWYTPWAGTYQCWKDQNFSGSDWCYTNRFCGYDRSSCVYSDKCA